MCSGVFRRKLQVARHFGISSPAMFAITRYIIFGLTYTTSEPKMQVLIENVSAFPTSSIFEIFSSSAAANSRAFLLINGKGSLLNWQPTASQLPGQGNNTTVVNGVAIAT